MEETLLRDILKVQLQILAELRLLRQALVPRPAAAPAATLAPAASVPSAPAAAATTPQPAAPERPAPEQAAPQPPRAQETAPPQQPQPPAQPAGSMLTMGELADLGGQFLDPGQKPRGKVKPVEAADLLRDIKAKNRAKSSAFAEFDNFGRKR